MLASHNADPLSSAEHVSMRQSRIKFSENHKLAVVPFSRLTLAPLVNRGGGKEGATEPLGRGRDAGPILPTWDPSKNTEPRYLTSGS